ncbi:hypothetical protein MC7420_3332 [Coleofasciculus chthonoplastes PCC 7420]|uniref:Uncharacterized protein n=1 Tax=Coleofasciculus chthonoplastes PCC 7420 TaxID=118168 RepID=B4VZ48_9CYAN|nr:hypothetical protein MC7420_3332 [Coleofasciculus chthonoplastes PCC 7420]
MDNGFIGVEDEANLAKTPEAPPCQEAQHWVRHPRVASL